MKNSEQEHAQEAIRLLCDVCRALETTTLALCEWPVGLPVWWARQQALTQDVGRTLLGPA